MATETALRRRQATDALAALGAHRSDRQLLSVQCTNSHHVAYVYRTEAGPVYCTRMRSHAHGSRDFVDTTHRSSKANSDTEYVDLLDAAPFADDELPAWCDCGPRTLSREQLSAAIAAYQRTLRLS
ncbi:hypothetical protein [Haloechinothrix halophila]|uniref:hypothetical protein n=1 Tax=Haloechinothrix halophila TaxID=1069073 RepID=UPI0003F50FA4|nr:hypothetical protein [Haloechinothrix halophila]